MTGTIGRTRTISWEDPAPAAESAMKLGGLEFPRAIMRRELPAPPMADLMGLVEVDEGRVVFECTPAEYHYNLFDSAMGCAVHTELPEGAGYTTVELKVTLPRPITAETIHVGRRIATAEARLKDESGRLYGQATTTCMVFRERSKERSIGEGGR